MRTVPLGKISLNNYRDVVGEEEIVLIEDLSEKVGGKSVLHVNSTAFGGGVSEILRVLVPLMKDVGLNAEWKVMDATTGFFNVTKAIHNSLQGADLKLTEEMKKTYLEYNKKNADPHKISDYHYVVIHDPQPLAIIDYNKNKSRKWTWRCHIDLSKPNQTFLDFLSQYIEQYDATIFTMKKYAKESLKLKKIAVIPPSIDPLSEKNKPLLESQILSILNRYDIDPEKPIITQVARYDLWKDPLGAIDVYRAVKTKIPDVQLLLIASMAHDDPEGWVYYEKTARHAGEDYNIHFLTDIVGVNDLEVNAFQRASNVALQMSTREGFGLSVTEALWKEVPVIGRGVGGIPLQIINRVNGFLIKNTKEAAEKTVYLLQHRKQKEKMGKKGKEHVLENFLITRHLKDYLELFTQLI